MSNTLITPSIVAKEALIVLENNMVMAGLVHRDFSKEYQKVGATVTIRKPTTFTATAFSSTVASQSVTESSVQVVLDQFYDVSFELTSAELSLNIKELSEQCIEPAMRAIAQQVDSALTALAADVNGFATVPATAAVADIANARAQLNLQKVPFGERRLVFCPITEAKYIPLDAFLHAEKRADGGKALREASMGRVMGFDCYMDQNIATMTQTGLDLAAAAKGAITAGATAATVDTLTDTEVIADNSLMKFTGQDYGYRITNGPLTVASTAIIVTFAPALHTAVADNCVITLQATHKENLVFHKNAFALVTAPLAPPIGGAKAATESYNSLSCRVVWDYAISSKKNLCSIDILYGVKTLDAELAAILVDAN